MGALRKRRERNLRQRQSQIMCCKGAAEPFGNDQGSAHQPLHIFIIIYASNVLKQGLFYEANFHIMNHIIFFFEVVFSLVTIASSYQYIFMAHPCEVC